MKIKFWDIPKFLEKSYKNLINEKVSVIFQEWKFDIIFDNKEITNLWIKINKTWKNRFYFDEKINDLNNKKIKNFSSKLLWILSESVDVPLSYLLGKKISNLNNRSIFILWNDWDVKNLSFWNKEILSLTKIIYTNNTKWVLDFLKEINIENKKIFSYDEIKIDEINDDIVLFQYGDILEHNKDLNKLLKKIINIFDKVYLSSYYTNFINKYSLSHSNYWNLFYLWSFSFDELNKNLDLIKNKLLNYIDYTNIFNDKLKWSLLEKTSLSIDFDNYMSLKLFFDFFKGLDLLYWYNIEIIYETEKGYYNIINSIDKIDISNLNNEKNLSNISIFIYKIDAWNEKFSNFIKFNNIESSKTITFISSPLSNSLEFTPKIIEEMNKSKYIFWETIEWVKNFYDRININIDDKNIYYWDDLDLIWNYLKKNNIYENCDNEFEYIPKVLNVLVDLVDNSQKIYFISDWWAPCILDPGDSIKKYLSVYYKEYSFIWIKWPNVISSVLLCSAFEYKSFFWSPFIYSITPWKETLKEINFFDRDKFKDTLIIFYSFWYNIGKDIDVLKDLFSDIEIQIIWDIWIDTEYNKKFDLDFISINDINYIKQNIKNTVYLLKYK